MQKHDGIKFHTYHSHENDNVAAASPDITSDECAGVLDRRGWSSWRRSPLGKDDLEDLHESRLAGGGPDRDPLTIKFSEKGNNNFLERKRGEGGALREGEPPEESAKGFSMFSHLLLALPRGPCLCRIPGSYCATTCDLDSRILLPQQIDCGCYRGIVIVRA